MDRLQGTDGIRAVCLPSSHPRVRGMAPVEAFERERVITEEFMELYTFSCVQMLIEDGLMRRGDELVVGWDPRDPSEAFPGAAIRGIVKAGARCLSLGVIPTPAVALHMLHRKAAGAVVITASHNLNDQNGIKLFMAPFGTKPFPQDDVNLTSHIRRWEKTFRQAEERGDIVEAREDAIAFFSTFMGDPRNSWLGSGTDLGDTVLVMDTAHGAYSNLAPDIMSTCGFREVITVNNDMNGSVNLHSGVAELEGETVVGKDLRSETGKDFSANELMRTLLELGEHHRASLKRGEVKLFGAAFDADGDRASILLYNPWRGRIEILSGDDTAFHQLRYITRGGPPGKVHTFVTTVESDPMLLQSVEAMGCESVLIPVGDKWILHRVLGALLTAHAKEMPDGGDREEMLKEVERLMKDTRLNHAKIRSVAERIVDDPWELMAPRDAGALPFSLGSEYTGHCITPGLLKRADGAEMMAFAGNGLKSVLNALVSLKELEHGWSEGTLKGISSPFPKGANRTFYSYYTDKSALRRGNPTTEDMEKRLIQSCKGGLGGAYQIERADFEHEPDMIFANLWEQDGGKKGWIFIRNSGTEDKTGVNVRGPMESSETLLRIGAEMARYINIHMKDTSHPYARAERGVLKQLYPDKALPQQDIVVRVPGVWTERLLEEMVKEGFIEKAGRNYRLTGMGRWFHLAAPPEVRERPES